MNKVFVFGSNLAGIHGAGSALHAFQNHGAISGQGEGRQGNSYGIPTKDRFLKTLPIKIIAQHVSTFIEYAKSNPEITFELTAIGCGLAGYKPRDIAPLFKDAPENVLKPIRFVK